MMGNNQMQNGEKNRKYMRLGLKIGLVVAAMQTFFIVMALSICVYMFRELITEMQEERCVNGTDMLAYELGKAAGSEDVNQILDEMKQRMGCEFTIFEGDVRTYSTLMQNGERVVGTKLSADLKAIVLDQGQSYVGEADILGISYLCSYVPTRGDDGEVNGLIFAGLPITDAKQGTANVINVVGMVSFVTITCCALFLAFILSKWISIPLREITRVAQRLERGDLGLAANEDIRVRVRSNDEVGILGQIFEKTIRQMQCYIGEISDVLGAIADGDLTLNARQNYTGDFQSIRQSLNRIHAALNSTMGKIAASTGQVSTGADQMSGTAQTLAQGTTQQASAVEEVSATVTGISESARQTSAAAEEVAKATKELIERSITTVADGSKAMNRVTQALEQTNQIAEDVTVKMTSVVEAVEKQTVAIAQVNVGIEQISAVVQANSATSEECAAVSEELSSQAAILRNLTDSFQLKG